MPVLEYDPVAKSFWFRYDKDLIGMAGATVDLRGGRRYVFGDVSPKNYRNIKLFKELFKGEAKATPEAKKRIAAIKEEQEKNYVQEYMDLFAGKPFEHQMKAVEAMQKSDRLALLLEQGLGKTYISLMSLRMFKKRDGYLRALVMCPAIVFDTWLAEAEKFTPELRIIPYKGDLQARLAVQRRIKCGESSDKYRDNCGENWDIILTTYDMLRDPDNKSRLIYKGLAWEMVPADVREKLANVLFVNDSKARDTLLTDSSKLAKTRRNTWLNACGKLFKDIDPKKEVERAMVAAFPEVAKEIKLYNSLISQIIKADRAEEFFNILDLSVTVFDEASRLINHASHTAKAMEGLKSHRVYLLSGTLCVGRPTDMYMPMRILDTSIFSMNWWQFRNRYCITSSYNANIITGYKNVDDIKARIEPFIISYKRDECFDMPDRTIVTCYYPVGEKVRDLYNGIITAEDYVKIGNRRLFCGMDIQKIQKCLQVLSGFVHITPGTEHCGECGDEQIEKCMDKGVIPSSPKCPRHNEFRESEIDIDLPLSENPKLAMLENDLKDIAPFEKVIVWAWYQYDLAEIEKLLKKLKIRYITADESKCAQRFEADDNIRVFLGQTMQGIGITLNSATTMIYYSHGTALEPRLQSMDRNMRIGQTRKLVVRDYVCRGSVEEAIVTLLQHKDDVHAFMQKDTRCIMCAANYAECREKGIQQYKKGCIYCNELQAAQEKKTLGLKLLED